MSDLISREAAIRAVNAYDYRGFTVEDVKIITDGCAEELRKLPSIEAEPVRPGRWIKHAEYAVCSECGDNCWADSVLTYKFCPNCGAKMDLEVQDENAG